MKRSGMILLASLLAACAPVATRGGPNAVTIGGFAFQPAQLQVKAGTTVTWTNTDLVAHTVTAQDGSFDSGRLERGQSFSHTFTRAGTVNYHCAIHPDMVGAVQVTAP